MPVSKDFGNRTMPIVEDFLARHPKIETRPYQKRIISKVIDAWTSPASSEDNHQHINIESPVGSGKTPTGLICHAIMQEIDPAYISTWCAMKQNLLAQVKGEIAKFDLKLDLVPISIFDNNPPLDQLVGRKIIHGEDESHHQAASSALTLRNRVQEVSISPLLSLGLSGTPIRADGMKLAYSLVIRDASARQLIRDGFLSKFDYYSLDKWNYKVAVKTYTDCPERWGRSVMFFHTVSECEKAIKGLKKAGIKVALVDENPHHRIDQLAAFAQGEWQVLVGCLSLTEGFNDPELQTVFLRSSCKGISIQMGGRALRLSPNFPRKQIVQATKGWCFMKYATPAGQFVMVDGAWRSVEANENVDKVSTIMITMIAKQALKPVTPLEEKLAARLKGGVRKLLPPKKKKKSK